MKEKATGGVLGRIGNLLRTAWLMLGAVVVCLLVVEVGARVSSWVLPPQAGFRIDGAEAMAGEAWWSDYLSESKAEQMRWESYLYWRHRPSSGRVLNVDERGRRVTWNAAVEGEPFRVFMFGGSTLWGSAVRDDFTIPSVVSRALHEAGVSIEVTNFGETGYVSTQGVISLMLELRRGNVPDAVVFYDGVNEVVSAAQEGVVGVPHNEHNRRRDFERIEIGVLERVAGRLASVALLRRLRAESGFGEVANRPSLGSEIVRVYEGNVRVIDGLAQEFGFQAFFYWQPVVFTKPTLSEHERAAAEFWAAYAPIYAGAYSAVDASPFLATHPGFSNLVDIFAATTEPLYIDHCHVVEAGNAAIGARIARDLAPWVRGAKPSS